MLKPPTCPRGARRPGAAIMRRLLRRINDWTWSARGGAFPLVLFILPGRRPPERPSEPKIPMGFIDLKPNLLVTTSTLPNRPDDPEPRFVLDLAIGLSRHFEVCVLAPRNPGARLTDEFGGVEIRRYPYAPLGSWETLTYPGASLERLRQRPVRWALVPLLVAGLYRATRRLLAERNFACVHAHWLVPQGRRPGARAVRQVANALYRHRPWRRRSRDERDFSRTRF